jgi:hypothetical protein
VIIKTIRFVLQTGLFEQFRLYAGESHETRRQPPRGSEGGEGMEREDEEDVNREGEGEGGLLTVGPSAKVLSLVDGFWHEGSMRNARAYSLPT